METKTAKRREIESTWPALSFYYHLSFEDLRKMPRWALEMWAAALPELLASQQLRALEASGYPHFTESAQAEIRNRYTQAMPAREDPSLKVKTREDLAGVAAIAGFGLVFEEKRKPEEVTDA